MFPPNSGHLDERGEGSGTGFALNVPLPPGTGDGGYVHVIDQVVIPAVRTFEPDLVLVASGFDAGVMDPLARQMVTSAGFRTMTERLLAAAADTCGGRVVMSHEGGYNPVYVPFCGLAVLEAMSGQHVLDDPFLALVTGFAGHELKPAEAEVRRGGRGARTARRRSRLTVSPIVDAERRGGPAAAGGGDRVHEVERRIRSTMPSGTRNHDHGELDRDVLQVGAERPVAEGLVLVAGRPRGVGDENRRGERDRGEHTVAMPAGNRSRR